MDKKFDLQKETAKLYGYDQKYTNASGPSAANIIADVLNMEKGLDSATRAILNNSLKFIGAGNAFAARSELDAALLSGPIVDSSQAHVLLQAARRMLIENPPSPSAPPFDMQKATAELWGYSQ
jgi:hypothetical protein